MVQPASLVMNYVSVAKMQILVSNVKATKRKMVCASNAMQDSTKMAIVIAAHAFKSVFHVQTEIRVFSAKITKMLRTIALLVPLVFT
jgi:hypothetical protein